MQCRQLSQSTSFCLTVDHASFKTVLTQVFATSNLMFARSSVCSTEKFASYHMVLRVARISLRWTTFQRRAQRTSHGMHELNLLRAHRRQRHGFVTPCWRNCRCELVLHLVVRLSRPGSRNLHSTWVSFFHRGNTLQCVVRKRTTLRKTRF